MTAARIYVAVTGSIALLGLTVGVGALVVDGRLGTLVVGPFTALHLEAAGFVLALVAGGLAIVPTLARLVDSTGAWAGLIALIIALLMLGAATLTLVVGFWVFVFAGTTHYTRIDVPSSDAVYLVRVSDVDETHYSLVRGSGLFYRAVPIDEGTWLLAMDRDDPFADGRYTAERSGDDVTVTYTLHDGRVGTATFHVGEGTG